MEKYFDNLTLGQFLLTGLRPIKVYIDGRYLILTDTDDIEDPLYGQGMTINGQMVHFDYRLIDHILVGDKPVTLDMLNVEEEEAETEEGEEEEEEEEQSPEEEEEEVEEEGHIRLGSLIEISSDEQDAEDDSIDAEQKAAKAKFKAAQATFKDRIKALKDREKANKAQMVDEDSVSTGIDTISEPYMYKVGDLVHDTNPSCKHYGSKGIVISLEPENVVRYAVTNNGGSYEQGDILAKTADQLEPM